MRRASRLRRPARHTGARGHALPAQDGPHRLRELVVHAVRLPRAGGEPARWRAALRGARRLQGRDEELQRDPSRDRGHGGRHRPRRLRRVPRLRARPLHARARHPALPAGAREARAHGAEDRGGPAPLLARGVPGGPGAAERDRGLDGESVRGRHGAGGDRPGGRDPGRRGRHRRRLRREALPRREGDGHRGGHGADPAHRDRAAAGGAATVKVSLFYLPSIGSRAEIERGLAGLRPELYQRMLAELSAQARLADALGYDSISFTEHHFHVEGFELSTNPILLDLFVGMQTKRIRVGQLGIVLPAENPIRVAENIAMLDHMTGWRANAGFARGYQRRWVDVMAQQTHGIHGALPHQHDAVNEANRAAFEECFRIIKQAWTEDLLSYEGRYWRIPPGATPWDVEATRRWGAGVGRGLGAVGGRGLLRGPGGVGAVGVLEGPRRSSDGRGAEPLRQRARAGGVRGHGDAAARAPARAAARALALRLDLQRAHPKRAAHAVDRALRDAGAAARGRRRLSEISAAPARAGRRDQGQVASLQLPEPGVPPRSVQCMSLDLVEQ